MPWTCAAFNCKARYKKGENLKFHSFPKDEILRKKWTLALRRINFNPSASSASSDRT
ncbi:THAP domain-containing protein 2-like [Coccinella septempunctata]|uniref:THAP domain-containing protein 2-like n=1 Tax=Coccinella septempunctata TaxID=41139 RepID=UPI001D05D4A8|nr:THAP domain-containing protein 2-like [Coccinella septempunctata]